MVTLSVVIATKNEERNIDDCLNSVKWADEIIVVDMNSADKTRDIAKKYTKNIIVSDGGSRHFVLFNKNLGINKAKSNWVLLLDADERVDDKLRHEILQKIKDINYDGFNIFFKTHFLGHVLKGRHLNDLCVTRLFRKGCAEYSKEDHHQIINFRGRLGELKSPIQHLSCNEIRKYIEKTNFYTSQDAPILCEKNRRVTYYDIFVRPMMIFSYIFFIKKMYKDGKLGLIYSSLASFYYFLEKAKIWEIHNTLARLEKNKTKL